MVFSVLLIKIKKNTMIALIFLFVCFISLGEEISWGQRIFNIQTPKVIADANRQSELNFHNLYIFSGGSTWRHFFKTGEFNYYQIFDMQNLFRIGFVVFFIFFPLMIAMNVGSNMLNSLGYHKPETYFSILITLFLFFSFIITIGNGKDITYLHSIQEIREMSYALFIAMYLIGIFYSEKTNNILTRKCSGGKKTPR